MGNILSETAPPLSLYDKGNAAQQCGIPSLTSPRPALLPLLSILMALAPPSPSSPLPSSCLFSYLASLSLIFFFFFFLSLQPLTKHSCMSYLLLGMLMPALFLDATSERDAMPCEGVNVHLRHAAAYGPDN
jgi:hypothetical protein